MKTEELFWLLNNDRDWIAYYEGLNYSLYNMELRKRFASFPDKTRVIAANANWTPRHRFAGTSLVQKTYLN